MSQPVYISKAHLFKQVVFTLMMMMIPTFLVANLRINLKLKVISHKKNESDGATDKGYEFQNLSLCCCPSTHNDLGRSGDIY